jgi:hypothetical protein
MRALTGVRAEADPWRMLASVLFVSVRNSVRTHMATAWFNALAHPARARATSRATSAGTQPADALGEHVVAVMREIGLDVADARPRLYTPLLAGAADLVIVVSPPALELALGEGGIARDGWLIEERRAISTRCAERVRGWRS